MLPAVVMANLALGGIDPNYAEKLVVYHVNPLSQSAIPINMDSGDARGDLYFFMQSPLLPLECANQSNSTPVPTPAPPGPQPHHFNPAAFDCNNPEKVDPNLMVNKVVLEIDNRTTGYAGCNLCETDVDPVTHKPCTKGEYVCDCFSWGTNLTCDPAKFGAENLNGSYSHRHHCDSDAPNWDCWRNNIARKTAGYWFSSQAPGQCKDDNDEACTWRVTEEPIRVKKSCVENAVFTTVEEAGPECFKGCNGGKRNTTDPCWIGCLFDTFLGPQAKNSSIVTGMPMEPVVAAWEDCFKSGSRWGCVA